MADALWRPPADLPRQVSEPSAFLPHPAHANVPRHTQNGQGIRRPRRTARDKKDQMPHRALPETNPQESDTNYGSDCNRMRKLGINIAENSKEYTVTINEINKLQ